MLERDNLNPATPMYIVTPSPMLEWMNTFISELKSPEMFRLVVSRELNPEPVYYY